MTKNFIIYFIINFVILFNGERALSQENIAPDLSQENGAAGDSICEIASRKVNLNNYGGKLSDYWAQEYIGSDLFREEFSDWLEENPPLTNLVTVMDTSPNYSHSVPVINLITHQKRQAVLPRLKIRNFWLDWDDERSVSFVSNFLASQPSFSFVNNSMYWRPPDYLGYKKISDRGSIIISASGNAFPKKVFSVKKRAGENLNIIIVGSLRPSGLISNFSQEDELVSILAPSNYEILSIGMNGEEKLFSGTSGATPLVTGSLAAFEWITNYHPTIDELKFLLKKTAIPSLMSHQRPNENGYGIVNMYKIARVAEKISLSCQSESPQERRTCVQEGINGDETYQFPEFSRNDLTDALNEYFPECASELGLGEPTGSLNVFCENKKEAIKKLRKEALLNPYNKNLWKALSCIYKKEGFLFNSIYYNTTALATEYPIDRDEVLSTVRETISARKGNFLEVLSDTNLSEREFNRSVEVNLSHELMVMFRIRSAFFPETLSSLLKEKLQFFESYEYVNSSFKEEHLSLVMHLSGLLNQKEDRVFFRNKGFSIYTSTPSEGSHQDPLENHLKICDLIDLHERGEREAPLDYNYPIQVRRALIKSSVFLENEDEKWSLLKMGLEDEDLSVKRTAVQYFYTFEEDEKKLQALKCLDNSNQGLEGLYDTEMVTILTSLTEENRENFFRKILSDETQSPDLKSSIIRALWSLNEETSSELLKSYFNHEDPILRKAVVSSLWLLDDESEIEKLLNIALNDKDFGVRSSALLSIGSLSSDEKKIEFITSAIENPDPKIKALSMEMIWFLAEPSMVEEYFYLGFQHSESKVREKAIRQVPYLDKSLQQKIDLFKAGMEDLDSVVQLAAVKSSLEFYEQISLEFSEQIRGEPQLIVDLYRTILSTISSLLYEKLSQEKWYQMLSRSGLSGLLNRTLRSILGFFTLSQNKDLELSFLDFFKEELNNAQANVNVVYIFKALAFIDRSLYESRRQEVYFSEYEAIRIGLVKFLEEMIKDEENSIDTVTQIVEYSIGLCIKEICFNEDLENSILISLKQGLNRLEIGTRIKIIRKILRSEAFQVDIYDVSNRWLNKARALFLNLITQGLDELKFKSSN